MSDDGPSDLELFDRWCAGDKEGGALLFRRHYRAVYRFFETKGMSDMEEPVQETFLACLRKRDQFRRESGFRAFLFGIARHALLEHWRRLGRQRTQIDFDEISIASLSTTLGTQMARRADHSRLLEALRRLSVDQQILLELSYWQQLDSAELAVIFDVEPGTIRTRLFRARDALLELIQSSEQTDLSVSEEADFEVWARGLPFPARRPSVEDPVSDATPGSGPTPPKLH
jgi:RNA polymerase sigma-70 factor, ECF subfamily